MKFLQITAVNVTLWVLTALLNGLFSGTWFFVFAPGWNDWWFCCVMIGLGTLVLSIPGFGIMWIVLLANYADPGLFRTILKTGLLVSIISSLLLLFMDEFTGGLQPMLALLTVMATLTSIMLHHSTLRKTVSS